MGKKAVRLGILEVDTSRKYSLIDIDSWPDADQWELIDGTPYRLDLPSIEHEDISTQIRTIFNVYIRSNHPECRVYGDPAGISLSEENGQMVRPDLFVVCHSSVINGRMQGIPTIIIEILSKSTAIRDVNTKKWLYETHGVPEYWIIDPVHQLVEVYRLQEGKYRFDGHFTKEDTVAVNVFEGFSIALSDVFLL